MFALTKGRGSHTRDLSDDDDESRLLNEIIFNNSIKQSCDFYLKSHVYTRQYLLSIYPRKEKIPWTPHGINIIFTATRIIGNLAQIVVKKNMY